MQHMAEQVVAADDAALVTACTSMLGPAYLLTGIFC
jgi:hypothetical protein